MRTITTLLLILVIAVQGFAQKGSSGGDAQQTTSSVTGNLGIRDLPRESDTSFVRDEQPGSLDTGCTYAGSLSISLDIKRVIGPTDDAGRVPVDRINTLISKEYLSPYALLRMPLWDVDRAQGEINRVYFNGHELNHATEGSDGTWFMNEFKVPMQHINFGRLSPIGVNSSSSTNTIRIDIDTTGAGWCTSVDWVALSFKAVSPVVMIHGNGSDGEFWGHDRQGFKDAFDDDFLVSDNSLTFSPKSNTRKANAAQLQAYLIKTLGRYGVDSLHIVAHSKGGLDTRQFLGDAYVHFNKMFPNNNVLKILSFTTLSTPHNGSVGADLSTTYTAAAKYEEVDWQGVPQFTQLLTWLNSFSGPDAGHPDLRPGAAALFNAENVPALRGSDIQFGTVVADSERTGSNPPRINALVEYEALMKESGILWLSHQLEPAAAAASVDALYQLIGTKKNIRLTTRFVPSPNPMEPHKIVAVVEAIDGGGFEQNDTLVTTYSGKGFLAFGTLVSPAYVKELTGGAGRNHADVANKGVGEIVRGWILAAERRNGDLK